MMRSLVSTLLLTSLSHAAFSPLSSFFDLELSTGATFHTGRSFGPGCSRGGEIPDGFIAVSMNGQSLGLPLSGDTCGMCLHIQGPAPATSNPADNVGVTGGYYAFVYDVCPDCTAQSGLVLGIPGKSSGAPTPVTWRAIPCPPLRNSPSISLYFEASSEKKIRFQIRGLSAPVIQALVDSKPLVCEGAFLIHEGTFPFTMDVETALGEILSIEVGAIREFGEMKDMLKIQKKAPAKKSPMQMEPEKNDPLNAMYGPGHITTVSGMQARTVITTTQANRQVITILTSPIDQLLAAKETLAGQRGGPISPASPVVSPAVGMPLPAMPLPAMPLPAMPLPAMPSAQHGFYQSGISNERMISTADQLASIQSAPVQTNIDPLERALIEQYLNGMKAAQSAAPIAVPSTQVPVTPAPTSAAPETPEPTNAEPITAVPATPAPTTGAPTTQAPATDSPATDSPATQAPTTGAPATQAPATDSPATDSPATQAPAVDA